VHGGPTNPLRSGYVPSVLEFRLLGPLEVVDDEGPMRLGGPKQRAVLAILLLSANRVVPVERLVDDLYGDALPASALTQIQAQISQLRKLFDAERTVVETRSPGYLIRLEPEQLDLRRFERLTSEAVATDDPALRAERLRSALELWRGPALAEFGDDAFAQTAIARLEDLRLKAVEDRIEAEISLGRHAELVAELKALVREHPLRERFCAQLMVALYRSERQADALEAYRRTRKILVDRLGIKPGSGLRQLERAILAHSPSLDLLEQNAEETILVVASTDAHLDSLLELARALVRYQAREVVLLRPVEDEAALARGAAAVNAARRRLDVPARGAAFATSDAAGDIVRVATSYDVQLVLLDAPAPGSGALPEMLVAILEGSPADVAIATASVDLESGDGVVVPFGGSEHDWAALELAAWIAASQQSPLRLVGLRARPAAHQRDASRLLADAALAVQRLVDIECVPVLAEPDELVAVVADATLVALGISPRWRREGVGATRRAVIEAARAPVVLTHRGPRPGGLAPRASRTRFTWSLQS
jgi:DNA-binding SARP family transcriptional activator